MQIVNPIIPCQLGYELLMPIYSLIYHITDNVMTLEYSYTTLYIMHYFVHHVSGVIYTYFYIYIHMELYMYYPAYDVIMRYLCTMVSWHIWWCYV